VDTLLAPMKNSMKTVAQGAATQVYVATQPGLEAHSGAYFSDCAVARTIPSGTDDALGEVLWGRTEALLAALG